MTERLLDKRRWNTVYLLSAVWTILMALAVGVQPLFLHNVLGVPHDVAGSVNASVQVVAEILGLMLVGYLGYLSDRFGRIPVTVVGFLLVAGGAFLAPFSLQLGAVVGIGGLGFYLLMRIVMSLGAGAIGPQLWTLVGDFTDFKDRARVMANAAFMMAFGGTIVYAVLMQIPQYGGLLVIMVLPAVIALAAAWLARKCLVDVAPRLREKKFPWRRVFDLVVKEPRLHLSFASAFYARSDMVFIGLFFMMWSIYFADLVGFSREEAAAHAGKVLGLVGVVILLSIPFWAAFIERFGRVSAIAAGMALSGLGFVSLGFIVNPFDWIIIVPVALVAAGQAACLIAPQVLTIDLTPAEIRGSVLGAFNMMGGLGIVFLVQSGGFYFDAFGPSAPFMLIGIGNILVMSYALWVLRAGSQAQSVARHERTDYKPLVFLLCLLPFISLVGRAAMGGLALDDMPAGYLNRFLGDWALNFLLISLALRPLREITGARSLARYSRMLGLFAFFYVVLHVLSYVCVEWFYAWTEIWVDIQKRPFVLLGVMAFALLVPMAVTSTKGWVKRLGGKRWKHLHRVVYAVNLIVVVHFYMATTDDTYSMAKDSVAEPLLYAGLVIFLLGYRVRARAAGWQDVWRRRAAKLWLASVGLLAFVGRELRADPGRPRSREKTKDLDDMFVV